MIYLLGMPARVVIGTSLVMILTVTAGTTMVHALTTHAVDIVLAALLLVGGVIGAQYGALADHPDQARLLRLALAIVILLVALRMFLGLFWRPDEIFSIEASVNRRRSILALLLLAPLLAGRRQAAAGAGCLRPQGRDPL